MRALKEGPVCIVVVILVPPCVHRKADVGGIGIRRVFYLGGEGHVSGKVHVVREQHALACGEVQSAEVVALLGDDLPRAAVAVEGVIADVKLIVLAAIAARRIGAVGREHGDNGLRRDKGRHACLGIRGGCGDGRTRACDAHAGESQLGAVFVVDVFGHVEAVEGLAVARDQELRAVAAVVARIGDGCVLHKRVGDRVLHHRPRCTVVTADKVVAALREQAAARCVLVRGEDDRAALAAEVRVCDPRRGAGDGRIRHHHLSEVGYVAEIVQRVQHLAVYGRAALAHQFKGEDVLAVVHLDNRGHAGAVLVIREGDDVDGVVVHRVFVRLYGAVLLTGRAHPVHKVVRPLAGDLLAVVEVGVVRVEAVDSAAVIQ